MTLTRRQFLHASALGAVAAAPSVSRLAAQVATRDVSRPPLVDTNVHLFEWPFRKLKYASTPALVAKLRKHGITEAWAGSFEGLFSKDLAGVNQRLVEECERHGRGWLIPVGSVNPKWPDWEEDLRRCHEVHRMRIVRVHPGYQGFTLQDPVFGQLLAKATERKLLVQIVLELEDPRVHHPGVVAPSVDAVPLATLLPKLPAARVQLLGDAFTWLRLAPAKPLHNHRMLWHDISSLEGVGAVLRLSEGNHGNIRGKIPLERLLFGSHAPYYPVESALFKLFESPFTLAQMQAVMAGNARAMLGPV